ncbi:MAG: hypothetical protein CL798_07125 [Chromatiales bacterium]|jgi:hypothetical protein|nr:hypothetical protein [Chromatiales bacterium]
MVGFPRVNRRVVEASCDHDLKNPLQQRLYAIALGYEDLNDHEALRQDVALQTAVERDRLLASASTLWCFENRADRGTACSRIARRC